MNLMHRIRLNRQQYDWRRFDWRERPNLTLGILSLIGLLLVLSVTACESQWEPLDPEELQPQVLRTKEERVSANRALAVPTLRHGPPAASVTGEPILRVRIMKNAQNLRFGGDSSYNVGMVGIGDRLDAPTTMTAPVTIRRTITGLSVTDGQGETYGIVGPRVGLRSVDGEPIGLNGKKYPGQLVVEHGYRSETDSPDLDVMNYVPIETYLPGVLIGELYGNWEPAAFRTQAVAARTYAIFEASTTQARGFDLESTTASQVYTGATSHQRALDAVRDTEGQVLVYDRRVVPAFYSADSGGAAQSAWDAFGDVAKIAPLRSRNHYDVGATSPHAKWGPINRSKVAFVARVKAWGVANRHAVARMNGLIRIVVTKKTQAGRPVEFTLIDLDGNDFVLHSEQFRWAANYTRPTLTPLERNERLKSSFVQVEVRGERVVIVEGRGYGHGVGLSQWGAQDMATRGYGHAEILAFFYPGAEIETLY
ncbi:SpoIID/LytB domain-containing protein [Mucisphaera calidilacus]|uniref:Amidase enhancer n=1 Tax=Mucisphaera calidilacus TaxID=2527982 RepID=A0A518BTM4_9BACT|nr:SpoIID/LytB domain-containing protein [Mucisphaera calidilacus]QDU70315.1 Amidase enhancer precursor [Mucisphaera calidilacus]